MYSGKKYFSSFFTPEIHVKVVEPVNWSAIYEDRKGKNRKNTDVRYILLKLNMWVSLYNNILTNAPEINPFIANERNGRYGSRAGVRKAPLVMAIIKA